MDKPGPLGYVVLEAFLRIWERKKGEQAIELARPSSADPVDPADLDVRVGSSGSRPASGHSSSINRR